MRREVVLEQDAHHVVDDAGEQQVLLMFMWAFL